MVSSRSPEDVQRPFCRVVQCRIITGMKMQGFYSYRLTVSKIPGYYTIPYECHGNCGRPMEPFPWNEVILGQESTASKLAKKVLVSHTKRARTGCERTYGSIH